MIVSDTNNTTKLCKLNKITRKYIGSPLIVVILLSVIIVIGTIIISRSNFNNVNIDINYIDFYNLKKTGYDSVLIVRGDTVDGLIDRYFNNCNLQDNADIRKEIKNEIMELNNLDRYATIYAGGYLLFPIYE